MFVDSHCHLNYEGLAEDQAASLARARAAGVSAMLNISTRAAEWDAVIATAERESDVMASVGIHPHEADLHPDVASETLVAKAAHPKVIAIGESGLDYYYDRSDRERQRQSFRAHIAPRAKRGCRSSSTPATPRTIPTIFSPGNGEGGLSGADPLLHRRPGFRRQGAGARPVRVDFRDRHLQERARAAGRGEDDSARAAADRDRFAFPRAWSRTAARPCEPAYVADTARFLAELRGEPLETLAAATSANFHRLFAKAAA